MIQTTMEYYRHFNPRAPRGARLCRLQAGAPRRFISIHVPREGHDYDAVLLQAGCPLFQSTCPARGTTYPSKSFDHVSRISIHVPREGHDCVQVPNPNTARGISIHVPREGHDYSDWYYGLYKW